LSPDLHLHNGLAEFEHPRPGLPPQVRFVGALVDPLPSEEVPSWWADVERADRPIVHVTQGTVADTDLGDLVLPRLASLYQAKDAARNSADLIERFHAESAVAQSR
jgi:UDP:flavonoid glycosyltransferase YjiC (YdhE family)